MSHSVLKLVVTKKFFTLNSAHIIKQAVIAYVGGDDLEHINYYRNHRVATIETGKKRNIGIVPSHDGSRGNYARVQHICKR